METNTSIKNLHIGRRRTLVKILSYKRIKARLAHLKGSDFRQRMYQGCLRQHILKETLFSVKANYLCVVFRPPKVLTDLLMLSLDLLKEFYTYIDEVGGF